MEEADLRLTETKKEAYEFDRDIMKGAVNQRTNKVVAEKVVRYFEDKLRSRVSINAFGWAYSIGRLPLSSTLVKHLCLINHWASWSQILYGAPMGRWNESLFGRSGSHYQDGHHTQIYGKNPLKIFFSGTKGSMILGLGMQHQGLGPNTFCSNDYFGFTFTFFMTKSNLLPYAFYMGKYTFL